MSNNFNWVSYLQEFAKKPMKKYSTGSNNCKKPENKDLIKLTQETHCVSKEQNCPKKITQKIAHGPTRNVPGIRILRTAQ